MSENDPTPVTSAVLREEYADTVEACRICGVTEEDTWIVDRRCSVCMPEPCSACATRTAERDAARVSADEMRRERDAALARAERAEERVRAWAHAGEEDRW